MKVSGLIQSFSSLGKSGVGNSESHILVIVIIISVGAFTIIVVVVGAFLCTRRTTSHQKKYAAQSLFDLNSSCSCLKYIYFLSGTFLILSLLIYISAPISVPFSLVIWPLCHLLSTNKVSLSPLPLMFLPAESGLPLSPPTAPTNTRETPKT